MARRWKPPKEDRTDADAVRREQEFRRKLRDVLEYGTGKEELQNSIMLFRVYVREQRGLY
jgi:hypothetical protein